MLGVLKNWDDNDSQNAYLKYFTPNATLSFGGPKVGRQAIQAARDSMIHPTNGPIVQCTHILDKGYVPSGPDSEKEIIIKGTVYYELKNGRKVNCPVASLGRFVKGEDEEWMQAEYYEVYLDSLELSGAIGEMLKEE